MCIMWNRKENVEEIKEDRNCMIGTTYIQVRLKTEGWLWIRV